MRQSDFRPTDSCPFIDDAHPGCDSHFTVSHLSRAFGQCVDGYRSCANYWRLARQQPQRLIFITANGRSLPASTS